MSETINGLLTNSGYLRINDIEFELPPERITIVKRDFSNQVSTIRSQTSTVIKSGRRMITMIIELHFGTGYNALTGEDKNANSWINKQLAPLLIQIRKCPFVSVENEKIRKELLGIDPSFAERIIAAVVRDVEINSAARSAGDLKVSITMDYFNYTPFTPDFKYKQILSNNSIAPSNQPGQPFRDFYYSGTTDGAGRFINSITNTKHTGMTILYKQYYELNFSEEGVKDLITSTSTEAEFNLDVTKNAFNSRASEYSSLAPVDKVDAIFVDRVKSLGWMEEKDPFRSGKNSKLLYRYKKFEIDGDITLDSDRMIIEAGSANLSTVTPNITLQGHTEPTTQFLGCSDARVTFQIFANAQVSNDKPVGTSRKLAQFQEMLSQSNKNAIRFHRESVNDGMFIRHPLAKLCKYKSYNREKHKVQVFNPANGTIEIEDINEYLFCHAEDISSETVPGHPFCSRVTVSFLENYIKESTEAIPSTVGLGQSVYQAGKSLITTLSKRFGITKTGDSAVGSFSMTDRPIAVTSEESAIAEKLVASLNTTMQIEFYSPPGSPPIRTASLGSVDEILNSVLVKNRKSSFRDSMIIKELDPVSTPDPMCYERFTELIDDIILLVESSDTQRYSDYSAALTVIKRQDAVPNESAYPDMMLPANQSQPDYPWFNISDTLNTEEEINKMATRAFLTRYEIGIQNAEKSGAELPDYLKSKNYKPATWLPAPALNPAFKYPGGVPGLDVPELGISFYQNPLDPVQQSMGMRKAVEKLGDNTYSMRRAMPTLKIYFKDHLPEQEDPIFASNGFWRNFSDVYDLNAIIDVRVAKSQDNPVDMMVIRLTNSRKDLMSKYFEIKNKDADEVVADLQTKREAKRSTTPEQSQKLLNSLENNQSDKVVREGTRIELRLGYENDPNDLSVEFIGRIMSASGTDIIEIVCQGDGVELIQELKGVGGTDQKTWTFDGETGEVITKMLASSPEIASFGSMRNVITNFGETPLPASFGGRSGLENIFAPPLYNSFARFGEKTVKYTGWASLLAFGPGTQPLLIPALKAAVIAGIIADTATVIKTAWSGAPFRVYDQTVWDALQELTMRHPGTVCSVTTFGNRSTIFFGYPDQLYFYRPATYVEKLRFKGIKPSKTQEWRGNSSGVSSRSVKNTIATGSTTRRDLIKNQTGIYSRLGLESESVSTEEIEQFNNSAAGTISKDAMKPYATYHIITSDHDIVMNDMQVSSEDVFNAIEIVYPSTSDEQNFDGSKGFSEYEKFPESGAVLADDDLKKAYIRKQTLVYHNAHKEPLEDMPERYATSNLVRSLENVYKGKIIILGRPNVKPHDVVFIEDFYNKVSGPVKVGAVTQVFSYKTGWLTEIHPKMLVAPTGSTLLESVLSMKQAAKFRALKNYEIFQTVFTDPKTRAETLNIGKAVKSTPIAARQLAQEASNYAQAAVALKSTRAAFQVGKAATGVFGKVIAFGGRAVAGPLLAFGLDAAVNRYLSWSRTRQPVAFIPVTRGDKPWVMGLHGFQDNTEMESIKKIATEISANSVDFYNRVVEQFRD